MPQQQRLDRAVERVIAASIHSVGDLDLVLALQRDPGRRWTVDELAREIDCPESWAGAQLERLRADGLVHHEPPDRYALTRTPGTRAAVDRLAELTSQRRADLVRRIFARRHRHR